MDPVHRSPGRTQEFVAARGFDPARHAVLLDREGRGRLFLEITTDADHPHSDPASAYESLLSTLEPGAQVRFLQIHWPDGEPRSQFLRQTASWPETDQDFVSNLRHDLADHLSTAPLPYLRRTILEVVLTNDEMSEWIGGAVEILRSGGLITQLLEAAEVQELARWMFDPILD